MIFINRILLISFLYFFISCNENIKLNVEDVKKLDYLNIFITDDLLNFEGYHNIDSELFLFSYDVNNLVFFFETLDQNAKKENWNKKYITKNIFSYSKKIYIFKSKEKLVTVNVSFPNDGNRVYFKVK